MGSNCFIVVTIEQERILLTVMDGNSEETTDMWVPLKKGILIGRKITN